MNVFRNYDDAHFRCCQKLNNLQEKITPPSARQLVPHPKFSAWRPLELFACGKATGIALSLKLAIKLSHRIDGDANPTYRNQRPHPWAARMSLTRVVREVDVNL